MKKIYLILVFICILIFSSCSNSKTQQIPSENTTGYSVFFCPRDNCGEKLEFFIHNSKQSIHCAFFDLDLKNVIEVLDEKSKNIDVKIVVDNDNYNELGKIKYKNFTKQDTSSQLSHNKFCIFDEKVVWTGSFNPTDRGNDVNNNNVVVIFSKYLAQNYENEFQELWNGYFGEGNLVKYPIISINNKTFENYFCPEDWCANKIIYLLDSANESIYFMTFSFTHKTIADVLIKKHNQGLKIEGVMEKSQRNPWNKFDYLNQSGVKVSWDKNSANMHHKVFIIDEKIVVTGSFNPTKNGDLRNDENILIIHDEKIAKKFLEEFEFVSKN